LKQLHIYFSIVIRAVGDIVRIAKTGIIASDWRIEEKSTPLVRFR